MALFPLPFPPGVFRRGTEYQAKGRVYDANLVRNYGPAWGPISGWVQRAQDAVSGLARAIIAWRDNGFSRWGAIGTHTKLYAFNSVPAIIDITPSDFTTGRANATAKTGYGYGVYGAGTYGTPRPDTGSFLPATVWDLDTWGENLVGCAESDGRLLEWDLNVSNDAAVISNAPTDCTGLVVTGERTLMALGASGNPRRCKWSDIEDNTEWTASATTRAGEFDLQTSGIIQAGRRVPGQTLILTDIDAWIAEFTGGVLAYDFRKVGADCGVISKRGVTTAGQFAAWWGQSGFWIYDGAIRPIACDVLEYVQGNLNNAQKSKVTAFHNVQYNEVWWFYPSNSSTENDSYVVWKYPTATDPASTWNFGLMDRTCAVEPGVFAKPIAIDPDGYAFDHETGSSYDGVSPYYRAGPLEIGNGDTVARCLAVIPDEIASGDATVSFRTRFWPNAAETVLAETTLTSAGRSPVRFTGRQAEVVVTFSADNLARMGTLRLDIQEGGRR